jgi:hypothetical protein
MTARVDKAVQLAVAIAGNNDGLASHIGGEVGVIVGDLALVGEIDPVALENGLHLEFEDLRVGEDVSGDAVSARFGIVFQRRVVSDLAQLQTILLGYCRTWPRAG